MTGEGVESELYVSVMILTHRVEQLSARCSRLASAMNQNLDTPRHGFNLIGKEMIFLIKN